MMPDSCPRNASRRRPHALRRAFTLIEVLLALAILGPALVVLTQAFTNVLVTMGTIHSEYGRDADLRFVRAQIARIGDFDQMLEGGEITTLTSGVAAWRAEVEMTSVIDLYRVFLTVELSGSEANGFTGQQASRAETVQRTFYLLRPSWSDEFEGERQELLEEKQRALEEWRVSQGKQ